MPPRIQSKVDYQLPVYYPELSKSKKSQGDKRTFQQKAWDFKHGTISADKRNFIKRAADDLYNQGILGASLAAISLRPEPAEKAREMPLGTILKVACSPASSLPIGT